PDAQSGQRASDCSLSRVGSWFDGTPLSNFRRMQGSMAKYFGNKERGATRRVCDCLVGVSGANSRGEVSFGDQGSANEQGRSGNHHLGNRPSSPAPDKSFRFDEAYDPRIGVSSPQRKN